MRTIIFSSLFLISILVEGSFGIKCYSCYGEDCTDPYTPIEDHKGCEYRLSPPRTASCQKVERGSDITRNCAIDCQETCASGACTYCCDTDFCNGGTHLVISWVAMGVALVLGMTFSTR